MSQDMDLVRRAVDGDGAALEVLLSGVQDRVFSLSLRMLGTVPDAEDAAQEILIRVMTRLSSFRGDCAFSTWVIRIAVNYLKNERRSRFADHPLSFEFYGEDILRGKQLDLPDEFQAADRPLLAEELKRSCTNVLLQCLAPEERCIFVLGAMFRLDSGLAGEVLDMTPEAYRQRYSRVRRRVAAFLEEYCGACGKGPCCCENRLGYAVSQRRLDPGRLEYAALEAADEASTADFVDAMEELDGMSALFAGWKATGRLRGAVEALLRSPVLARVRRAEDGQ